MFPFERPVSREFLLRGQQACNRQSLLLCTLVSPLALHSAGEPGAPGLAGTTRQAVLHIVQGAPVLDFSRLKEPRESGVGIEKARSAGWCWPAAPVSERPLGVTRRDPLD